MSPANFGDAVQIELLNTLAALDPMIIETRDYLLGIDDIYKQDCNLMMNQLWRCLDAMMVAKNHIERAEGLRKDYSPRRRAALERERRKRNDYHE